MQIIRREMKMAGVGQVIEVQILPAEFGDCSHIGENVAPSFMVQDHREASGGRTVHLPHARHIYASLPQAFEGDLTKRVVSDAGLKSHPAAKYREIVRHDR